MSASRLKWLAPLAIAVVFGLGAWGGIELSAEIGRVAVIWIPNGILLALLLIADKSIRPISVAAATAGNIVANLLQGDAPLAAVLLALCNTFEVSLALYATAASLTRAADLLRLETLWRFFVGALLIAPACAAVAAAIILHVMSDASLLGTLGNWFAADSLGMAVMTPLVLALRPAEFRAMFESRRLTEIVWPMLLLVVVAMLVFMQSTYPFLFMLLPPLLLVAFRLGFSGAAVGVFVIACIAMIFTVAGSGPFTLVPDGSIAARVVALQCLLATTIITSYPVCAVLARQQDLLNAVAASEQHLRAIAENSSDIIVLTDREGIRRFVSPAVEAVLGYKPEELIGTHGAALIHPDDQKNFSRGLKRLKEGTDHMIGTFRIRHKNGDYVWVESSAKQLRDARTGEAGGWVSTVRDISARKRVDRLKDEFISTVSHELRTPLTSMLGALGLVASGQFAPGSERVARLIEMAKVNGDRLARLVNDILDFEKVSSGAMRFEPKALIADQLVHKAVLANQQYAERLGVSLRTHLDAAATINVDPDRFEQVLANLLSNAAKFSHRGGVVDVHTTVRDGQCVISVRDYGIGIPAAFRSAIFDRFSQADSSDQRARGGTGLGMAIAKHMTERMGGTLTFESEEGSGTVFYLAFPVASMETRAGTLVG